MIFNVGMYMTVHVAIIMLWMLQFIMLRTSQLRRRMCAPRFSNVPLFPDNLRIPNFHTPPNFSNVLFFVEFMFFQGSLVRPKFSNVPFLTDRNSEFAHTPEFLECPVFIFPIMLESWNAGKCNHPSLFP